jgi:hypothetical protein
MITGGPVRKIGEYQGRAAAVGRTERRNVIKREKPERSDGISCCILKIFLASQW